MEQKHKKSTKEILEGIDNRAEHLDELDRIREERRELKCSCLYQKMKDK